MKKKNLKRMKGNKAITLIALVVTIVVLLILAGITISTLFGENGVLNAARRAEEYTKQDETNTEQGIKNLEDQMTDKLGDRTEKDDGTEKNDETWKNNENGTFTSGSKTVTIGDYVTYDPRSHTHTPDTSKGAGTSKTSGGQYAPVVLASSQLTTQSDFTNWRVLGLNDEGQLELISSNPSTQELYLANDTGYLNAEDNLNNFCNDLYGKGKNVTGARSLNIEDIDKLAKYDRTTYNGYGEKWQYQFPSGGSYLQYRKKETGKDATYSSWSNMSWTDLIYQKFRVPGSSIAINRDNPGEGQELEYTYYQYNIADNITTEDGYTSELATTISDMITKGTGTSNINQWILSRSVDCDSYYVNFGVRSVKSGNIDCRNLFRSNEFFSYINYRVRPVVTIESGVKLTGTGSNLGTSSNPYTLSK